MGRKLTREELEEMTEGILGQVYPQLKGHVKIQIDLRCKHVFEARRRGEASSVKLGVLPCVPSSPNWPQFSRVMIDLGEACLRFRRSEHVEALVATHGEGGS